MPNGLPDVLVLSRLISPLALPLADRARERGVPVAYQIDDDLLDVPELLGAEKVARYRDPKRAALLLDALPPLRFEVVGTVSMPTGLERFGTRVRHHPGVRDHAPFLARRWAMGWWVGVAPLVDHAFNRCEADIKWLDCRLAGMAVVASDLPVYHRACAEGAGLLAATEEDWMRHLTSLLTQSGRCAARVAAAQRRVAADYGHVAMRAQALEVFAPARQIATARRGAGPARDGGPVAGAEIKA